MWGGNPFSCPPPITHPSSRLSQDGEPHRADEAHFADLFAGMDFDFVAARCPVLVRREQLEVAAFILQCNVHGVFADDRARLNARYPIGNAPAEDFKALVVLMEGKHDEDILGVGGKAFGRVHRHNLVGLPEAHFFFKPFGHRDGAEHACRRGVEVIGLGVFGPILKFRNREVFRNGQFSGPQGLDSSCQGHKNHGQDPIHTPVLVHPLYSGSQGCCGEADG